MGPLNVMLFDTSANQKMVGMFPMAEINKYLCATATRQKWLETKKAKQVPFLYSSLKQKKT